MIFWALLSDSSTFGSTYSGTSPNCNHAPCAHMRLQRGSTYQNMPSIPSTLSSRSRSPMSLQARGYIYHYASSCLRATLALHISQRRPRVSTVCYSSPLSHSTYLPCSGAVPVDKIHEADAFVPSLTAYSFLDPGKEHAKLAGYIIAVGIAECLAFLLARGLVWVRDKLAKRSSTIRPGSPDSAQQRSPSEDWEEIERPGTSIGHAV